MFIFIHYFELEFESFQIYQLGQFFMRLSHFISFLDQFFIFIFKKLDQFLAVLRFISGCLIFLKKIIFVLHYYDRMNQWIFVGQFLRIPRFARFKD